MKSRKLILGVGLGVIAVCGVCLIAFAFIVGNTPATPTVSIAISPAILKYGTEAKIELTVTNPVEGAALENYTTIVSMAAKDSNTPRTIKELPVNLPAGQTFKTTVTWLIDSLPAAGKEFQIEATLLDSKKVVQGKATPAPFTFDFSVLTPTPVPGKPTLTLSVTPSTLSPGITAVIRVEAQNPNNGASCANCFLSVVYRPVGGKGGIEVARTNITLEVNKSISKELSWRVSSAPTDQNYEMAAAIIGANNSFFSEEKSIPIKFSKTEMSLSITPTALSQNVTAMIKVKVANNGTTDWQSYKLLIGYSRENESGVTQANMLALNLGSGKTFEQDVPWKISGVPTAGKYRLRAVLLGADNITLSETETPIEFK